MYHSPVKSPSKKPRYLWSIIPRNIGSSIKEKNSATLKLSVGASVLFSVSKRKHGS